jgi:hypothetical protein
MNLCITKSLPAHRSLGRGNCRCGLGLTCGYTAVILLIGSARAILSLLLIQASISIRAIGIGENYRILDSI